MRREIFINRARTCAVTGHRILNKDFDKVRLEYVFNKLIEGGYNCFLVGMALGFDTECFCILEKLREKNSIKIIACIPCLDQDKKFNKEQKEKYQEMLTKADEKVIISQEYTSECMMQRNRYMVDNCSVVVSYKRREVGGTAGTVRYAKKQGVSVIEL